MDVSTIIRNDAVAAKINEGVTAQASALQAINAAALEFVTLIPRDYESDDIPAIVKQGRDLYNDDFDGNHNLRAYFGDVATLALAGNAPISFQNRKKEDVHTTGLDAVDLPKHDLKAAASAVREDLGQARESGGGRKPKTPEKAPAQVVFSLTEFKTQVRGLFGNTKNPLPTINKVLSEYHCAVVSSADLEAFNAWKKANTKPAK